MKYKTEEERKAAKKERDKRYYLENKEKIKANAREYYEANKETLIEKAKEYYAANNEKIQGYKKNYYKENKDRIVENTKHNYKQYKKTQTGRAKYLICTYKESDEKRHNRGECTLTSDWITDNIFASHCIYCGESDWTKLGCDRIDDNLPHTPENCVCSCKSCNIDRYYKRMSVEEYKNYKTCRP